MCPDPTTLFPGTLKVAITAFLLAPHRNNISLMLLIKALPKEFTHSFSEHLTFD